MEVLDAGEVLERGAAPGDVQVNCDVSLMLLCRWRILLCRRAETSCRC